MKDAPLAPQADGDEPELKRSLSNRHIQLIAIGGAIGTGLFMGSGKTISLAGPSIIFVYMIIGFMLFFVMRAMGELLLSNLNYKSFIDFATDLLGPMAGYFTGWTYWFCWIVTGIADVIAISGYTQFWFPDIPLWMPAIGCVAVLLSLNLLTVKMFGELEFWFAMIKIIAICGLVCTGLYMVVTSFQSPTGNTASLTNLWNDGGMFPHGLMGFFAGFQIAVFAFVGIELVGTQDFEGYGDNAFRLQALVKPSKDFEALFNYHQRNYHGSATLFRANILKQGTNDLVDNFDYGSYPTDGINYQKLKTQGGSMRLKYDLRAVRQSAGAKVLVADQGQAGVVRSAWS